MILNTRSENHLRAVFIAYQKAFNTPFEKVIKSEFSGDLNKSLVALVRSIENRPKFLAERFERSMAGMGTRDEMLIRLTVRCREPNLMTSIKHAYQSIYGKSLFKRVEGETSGDYRKLLLAIIGP